MRENGLRIVLSVLLLVMVSGCQSTNHKEQDLLRINSAQHDNTKKVIFLLVDSLMYQAIDQGINEQELPTFKFLTEQGQYYRNMVSSFPTMSVTIDSSLLTGSYPDIHKVPGLSWYSADQSRMINYGAGPMEVLKQGVHPVLADALIHLNDSHLNKEVHTIYDDLAKKGLKSGSINGLIYRGATQHKLQIPLWMQGPASLPQEIEVNGPDLLSLGSLSDPFRDVKDLQDGLVHRMGINNEYAVEAVKYLIQTQQLPDFLYVYLPELDHELHKKGPSDISGVKKLDQQLQSILQAFGSREKALQDAVIIIAGDSGMTQILSERQNPAIELPDLLSQLNVLRSGDAVSSETEIALAVNETMAYVYSLKTDPSLRDIANLLTKDSRVDLVAWKEEEWIHVIQGSPAKQLRYKAGGPYKDPYNQTWTVEQDTNILDIKVNSATHSLDYEEYPDVLKRLSGALHSHAGKFLVVTAKPGYEFTGGSSPLHEGGGGHGSIRKKESLVPLIIAGTDHKPEFLRIVDLKAYLLNLVSSRVEK